MWDCKFPLCIIPHVAMRDDAVRFAVHKRVAEIVSWSMGHAASARGPTHSEDTTPFSSAWRHSLANMQLAGGWRLAYLGFKSDMKARAEAHRFDRYYLCDFICEACMAQKAKRKSTCPFTDFSPGAAHRLTKISHETYLRTAKHVSPWQAMPGFHLFSVFRDMMHILFLGTLRTMIPSCIVFWLRFEALGNGSTSEKLLQLSKEMKELCRRNRQLTMSDHVLGFNSRPELFKITHNFYQQPRSQQFSVLVFCGSAQTRIRVDMGSFTPSNVGIAKGVDDPELCSTFKAAAVKSSLWFFTRKAEQVANDRPEDCALLQKDIPAT